MGQRIGNKLKIKYEGLFSMAMTYISWCLDFICDIMIVIRVEGLEISYEKEE